MKKTACLLLVVGGTALIVDAQTPGWQANPAVVQKTALDQPGFNYDEAKVGAYTLPDALRLNGKLVQRRTEWPARRAEILDLFRDNVYGRRPTQQVSLRFAIAEEQRMAMGGAATMKRIVVTSVLQQREHRFEIILFLPNSRTAPVPVFLLLNNRPITNTDATRTNKSPFWPAEDLIARGYGIAALQNAELAPDDARTFREGVMRLFEGTAQKQRAPDAWGAIAAWGWGASRALDYLETDARIDASRVAVVGHSRGGKAALWAGAEDDRFAMVVSNDSGEGGAALSRRDYGETIARLNASFPHWFAGNYVRFNDRAAALPVDQHLLLSLIAPRPLYVASADQDLWADPRGEFLALSHSSPVYALFDEKPISIEAMPPIDTPFIVGRRAYHVRTGGHDLTVYDWQRFADFADRQGWNSR